jgi:diguanylate cyclase (GGDEF)-like protein
VATDFIEEQAAIIAICLENVINNERLKHLGLTDPLTGVHNRRYIESRLTEEIRRTQRHRHMLSCMYIDIDYFKQINDRHGHLLGDEVLCEVARRVKSELRLSDALGRFGGEEFIALLIDTDLTGARQVAERIRSSIAARPFALSNGETCHLTVSIGLSTLAPPKDEQAIAAIAQGFLSQADAALYQAKDAGRNRVIFFD